MPTTVSYGDDGPAGPESWEPMDEGPDCADLPTIRQEIDKLEFEHRQKGRIVSGRILYVSTPVSLIT